MTPEGHNDLMPLIEQQLRTADHPLTCHDLFDVPEIRAIAPSANRISDYLGVMFRRGQLSRVQSTTECEHGRARWAYIWKEKDTPAWREQTKLEPKQFRPKPVLDRPNLYVTEDGGHLTLELAELTITIQIRKK